MNTKELKKIIQYFRDLIIDSKFENHLYICGGAVRDLVMGNDIKDIDFCIDLKDGGLEFAEFVCNETKSYKANSNPIVFPKFGTAKFNVKTVDWLKGIDFECVETRKETYRDKDSRNPIVEFGTLEDDCFRRDLTINSLYLNVSNGEILDLTKNGLNDIKNHIIRTTNKPSVIFDEDPLRMIRCIRFACRFGWKIEKDTFLGIISNSSRINIISQERITEELNKILVTDKPSIGFDMLYRANLLDKIIPELYKAYGMLQNIYHYEDVFHHMTSVMDKTKPIMINRLSGLFHDIGKIETKSINKDGSIHFYNHENYGAVMAESILKKLKYSNDVISKVCKVIRNHMRFNQYGDKGSPSNKSIRKLISDFGDDMDLIMDIINADMSCHRIQRPNLIKNIKEKIDKVKKEEKTYDKKNFPINGKDIMERFNLKPSKKVGELLSMVTDHWFDNPKITKEECFKVIEEELKKQITEN